MTIDALKDSDCDLCRRMIMHIHKKTDSDSSPLTTPDPKVEQPEPTKTVNSDHG